MLNEGSAIAMSLRLILDWELHPKVPLEEPSGTGFDHRFFWLAGPCPRPWGYVDGNGI